ncbi:hypothetical protein GOM71_19965 [Paenibacillus sp. NEAU-GSW1]|nr:hypothetical protein [Paenibacillus sp. NEAU-GSW1]
MRSTIYDPAGKQALHDGQLGMFYGGAEFGGQMAGQSTTAQVVRLSGRGDDRNLQGLKNKINAWKYVESRVKLTDPIDFSNKVSDLGDQNLSAMPKQLKELWNRNIT